MTLAHPRTDDAAHRHVPLRNAPQRRLANVAAYALALLAVMAPLDRLSASGNAQAASAAPHPAAPSGVATLADLAQRNMLVIIRHANAPGVGDPPGYNLDDCSTQRNLDDKGREQAAAIGRAWKQAGIFPTRVWTSAWCRCIETAQRMELGPVALLPQLNSSFEDSGSRARQTDALFKFIKGLKPNGGPYLMVTHQVNISAISNDWVETGAGIVLDLKPDGTWTLRKLAQ